MIQANELRIGNHIKFECDTLHMTTFGRITGIEQHFQYKDGRRITKSTYGASLIDQWGNERQADVVDIEPIPLTSEILEKAGFEITGIDKSIYTLFLSKLDESEFSRQRIDFFVDNSHGKVELCRSGVCFKMAPCQYVHQLQNLIHALTGEELNIQL